MNQIKTPIKNWTIRNIQHKLLGGLVSHDKIDANNSEWYYQNGGVISKYNIESNNKNIIRYEISFKGKLLKSGFKTFNDLYKWIVNR